RAPSGPKLVLFDGMAQTVALDDLRLAVTRFENFTYDLGAVLSPSALGIQNEASLSTAALLRAGPEEPSLPGRSRAILLYEGHNRLAQPFLATVAALIGFAALMVGAFSRFGLWKQLLGGSLGLVMVQMVANSAETLGVRDERLWPLVWAGPLVGALLTLFLL